MHGNCTSYPRKGLYSLLTVPMIAMYIALATFLWRTSPAFFAVYLGLFAIVAVAQSYVCVCWQCPYVGRFAPCVGGFCLPSSRIAPLWKNTRRTKRRYNIVVTAAFVGFLGFIVLPFHFLFQRGVAYFLGYLAIVLVYAAAFLWSICPACATRQVCPGGQAAMKLRERIAGE